MFLEYPGVYPTEAVQREVAAVLARAFFDYPGMTYIMPDQRMRPEQLCWWWSVQLRYVYRHGLVFRMLSESSRTLGVALWLPPGGAHMRELELVRLGLYAAPLRLGLLGVRRAQELGSQWVEMHQSVMPAPHWYLLAVGVEPGWQRRGIGRRLLTPIMRRAEEEGLPCYLETTRRGNLPFYQRQGFEICIEYALGASGDPCWGLRRPPPATA